MITRIDGQWLRSEDTLKKERRSRRKPRRFKTNEVKKPQDHLMYLMPRADGRIDVMA